MSDQSESSPFQNLFESALHDYEKQTGIPLANHALAVQLQNCQSVDSVSSVLQDQARALSKFRGGDKIINLLKSIVSVLSKVSATTALGRDVSMVCLKPLIGCSTALTPFDSYVHLSMQYILVSVSYSQYVPHSVLHAYSCDIQVSQAFKGVSSDLDALVDLLESIELFLNRLDIYTKVPPTLAMTEIIVKIMVELLSTLALATKQIKQGRPSESVFGR